MFTGIIERKARVISASNATAFRRLLIASQWDDVKLGQSVSVNGACLTISDIQPGEIGFDVIQETLDKTNLGLLGAGDWVNLERPLRADSRIDGHFVQGHVDGTGRLARVSTERGETRLTIAAPPEIGQFLSPKGSIAVDGVSLTIARLTGHEFDVALIPTTLQITTLGEKNAGWPFNLEADVINKAVIHFLENRAS